jgi:hypothetical protein
VMLFKFEAVPQDKTNKVKMKSRMLTKRISPPLFDYVCSNGIPRCALTTSDL